MQCVALAHSTVIPIVFKGVLKHVEKIHHVIRTVCLLFLRHLRETWFGLSNKPLEKLVARIREVECNNM